LTLGYFLFILQDNNSDAYHFEEVVIMGDQFTSAAEAVGATVKRFSGLAEALPYLHGVTGGEKVAASALPEEYATILNAFPLAAPAEYPDAGFCISTAHAGIARTGSLLFDLTDPVGRSATALPLVHLVILKASAILPDLRAAAPLIGTALGSGGNTYLSITTGPSRTADIERVLTIGVHGPKELHILII
jgi:L-lactate dehydrogenase complex protein LldG